MYKKNQGLYTRWGMFSSSLVLFLFGAYRLFYSFPTIDSQALGMSWGWAYERWLETIIPLVEINVSVTPRLVIALASGVFFGLICFYLSFKHERISEFLIDTESEMRKVSWPTGRDVVRSSMAVILIVFLLGGFLLVSDVALNWFFGRIF